jgi:hypothetical protein
VTLPPLEGCGPVPPPGAFAPTGLGQGVLLVEPGVPWSVPAGWSVLDRVVVRVEVGLQVELAEGVPGPILPVLLLPPTPVAGAVTAAEGQVAVDVDVTALRASVEVAVAEYLATNDPPEPHTWVVDVTMGLGVAHAGGCEGQLLVVPADGLLGEL